MQSARHRPCDASARKWCLRVSTVGAMLLVFSAMLFYSWGGVLFDDDPYIVAYVNTCSNVSVNAARVNGTHWRVEAPGRVMWLPSPPGAAFAWDGQYLSSEQCVGLLGMGY